VKTVVVVLGIAGALVAQGILSAFWMRGTFAVNLVLVVVVYVALAYGALTGLLAGALGGLVQDALGGGIVGVGGMTKTLIGFVVGILSAQFNLSTGVARVVMFVAATFVHDVMFAGLQAITAGQPFSLKLSAVMVQALINGLVGFMAFVIVENGPQLLANRRMRRASLSKRRF